MKKLDETQSLPTRIKELQSLLSSTRASLTHCRKQLEHNQNMNRAKNKYLVECNMFDDFFCWYSKNYPYVEDTLFS